MTRVECHTIRVGMVKTNPCQSSLPMVKLCLAEIKNGFTVYHPALFQQYRARDGK